MEEKTFAQWAAVGRAVMRGQRADYFLVAPDMSQAFAVFRENQTEPMMVEAEPEPGWFKMPADEWQANQQAKKVVRPTIKIRRTPLGKVEFWIGNNRELIAAMKRQRMFFNRNTYRWTHPTDDLMPLVKAFVDSPKYTVILEGSLAGEVAPPLSTDPAL